MSTHRRDLGGQAWMRGSSTLASLVRLPDGAERFWRHQIPEGVGETRRRGTWGHLEEVRVVFYFSFIFLVVATVVPQRFCRNDGGSGRDCGGPDSRDSCGRGLRTGLVCGGGVELR
ncbi:uncharacterized protein M6B38_307720 [Iris pallida]|uniref:Uncharacterized protein n=1 Tax=Iris pallida TaxID=29817 RepID=A0AAX6HLR3_IRIPA|nr:uncharacterized protein M6B38_307720 [Iris pallida]